MNLKNNLVSLAKATILLAISLSVSTAVVFAADATGAWSWVLKGTQGRPNRTVVANLKSAGNELTGTINFTGRDGEQKSQEISDGKVDGDKVSFKTVQVVNDKKVETKYDATITGNSLKGQTHFLRDGDWVDHDWAATRK